jgi:hypothetical protein
MREVIQSSTPARSEAVADSSHVSREVEIASFESVEEAVERKGL